MSLDFSLIDNCCEHCNRGDDVFSINITHNLNEMAEAAGLYKCLWRPDENGFVFAKDIINILECGLKDLQDKPVHYRVFNSSNGWGDYSGLVKFVQQVLKACKEYPNAKIYVSR